MKAKRLILIFSLFLVFFSLVYSFGKRMPKKNKKTIIRVEVAKIKEGKIVKKMVLLGWGEYRNEVYLTPKLAGEVKAVNFDEGDYVQTGEVVVEIDDKYLQYQKKNLELQLLKTKLTLEKQKINYQILKNNLQMALKMAQLEVDLKDAFYQKLKNGARREELAEAYQNLESIKSKLESARQEFLRMKKLFQKKSVSAQKYDNARFQYKSLEAQYKSVAARYKLLKKGARKEDLKQAKLQLELARVKLNKAKLDLEQLKVQEEDLKITQNAIQNLENQLAELTDKINDARVRAPFSGILSEKDVALGKIVNLSQKLFLLSDISHPQIKFSFLESDFPYLKVGKKVEIEFPYLKEKTQGEISKIIPRKDKNVGKLFGIVTFRKDVPYFSSGVFARLHLIRKVKNNVIKVKLTGISSRFDGKYLFLVKNKGKVKIAKKVKVKLGFSNEKETEILYPQLKEGERYILYPDNLEGGEEIELLEEIKESK